MNVYYTQEKKSERMLVFFVVFFLLKVRSLKNLIFFMVDHFSVFTEFGKGHFEKLQREILPLERVLTGVMY